MAKSLEDHFVDWEGSAFGFGYGTGEPHTIAALKAFFGCLGHIYAHQYDYEVVEKGLTPTVAWLMINALCRVNVIEYGSSPRYGWLTPQGERLKAFVDKHTADELYAFTNRGEDYVHCYPTACNCGPNGHVEGKKCDNPFWTN